ncbi:MAG: glycosyltransferase family 9 protein [Hormoscilla sp. GM102CHS1]|nr:glycosyltransferase family 9 protein [Hormoscilla sp. GM102CHS1]
MRVVALVPGGIGDQILFFPTLEDLKQSYPSATIDVIVEPRAKGAYRVCKSVNEVIPFNFKDRNSAADWGNLLGVIRDREYEVALSLGQRWAVGLLLWLTGIPTRVSYSGPGSLFLTNPVPLKTEQYAASMYHDLLQGLSINRPCQELTISLLQKDLKWAEAQQRRLEIAESGYLLIHGGSSELAQAKGIDKIYPVKNWQQIIQNLQQQQPDLPIVVLQGPEDAKWVSSLLQSVHNLKVTSPGDVGKLAAIIASADLMLCTESAPMHLAIGVKTPTIALFGPTNPEKLLPNSGKYIGIKSPTGKMADISPETVLEKILGG